MLVFFQNIFSFYSQLTIQPAISYTKEPAYFSTVISFIILGVLIWLSLTCMCTNTAQGTFTDLSAHVIFSHVLLP